MTPRDYPAILFFCAAVLWIMNPPLLPVRFMTNNVLKFVFGWMT